MKEIILTADNLGTQKKYRSNNYWYKINNLGNEALSETLSSLILKNADLPDNITFVDYNICKINDKIACKSMDFLNPGERFVSLQAIYKYYENKELSDEIFKLPDIKTRYLYLCNYFSEICEINIADYLKCCLTLDAIICNPDRHFGNLGVIQKENGDFRLSPIFDNGQGLGQNFNITPPDIDYSEKIKLLNANTISGSFELVINDIGSGFTINYDNLKEDIDNFYNNNPEFCNNSIGNQVKEFLNKQLDKYEKLLSNSLEKENIDK